MAQPAAFERRYEQLFTVARRAAFRVLHDGGEAQDVAAETLARAYARWPRVSAYADAWVTRVAVNLATDAARRKAPEFPDAPIHDDRPVDGIVIRDALRGLSARQREVVALRFLLDFDEVTTADILGVSVDTMRTHLKRALGRLRGDLAARLMAEEGQR